MKIEVIASGSSGNCYKISNEDTTLLIECGIPYKKIQEALNFKTTDIDGVLVSHEHGDHSKACKDLIKAGVDLYMTKGTKEALKLESHRVKTFEESNDKTYRWGSPLHMRGLRTLQFSICASFRITPAYAGTTFYKTFFSFIV